MGDIWGGGHAWVPWGYGEGILGRGMGWAEGRRRPAWVSPIGTLMGMRAAVHDTDTDTRGCLPLPTWDRAWGAPPRHVPPQPRDALPPQPPPALSPPPHALSPRVTPHLALRAGSFTGVPPQPPPPPRGSQLPRAVPGRRSAPSRCDPLRVLPPAEERSAKRGAEPPGPGSPRVSQRRGFALLPFVVAVLLGRGVAVRCALHAAGTAGSARRSHAGHAWVSR